VYCAYCLHRETLLSCKLLHLYSSYSCGCCIIKHTEYCMQKITCAHANDVPCCLLCAKLCATQCDCHSQCVSIMYSSCRSGKLHIQLVNATVIISVPSYPNRSNSTFEIVPVIIFICFHACSKQCLCGYDA
jgi:hypothetical protein